MKYEDARGRKGITVSQLNNYIKQVFDAEEMLHNIEVVGDIDGINMRGNAVYFSLKDEAATIPCVCYSPDKLKNIKSGSQVVVRGTVGYWHKAGKISFTVYSIEAFGFGQLFLKFQQLQEKLKAEGMFDAGVKKAIPENVKRVGVITSRSGSVIHDIIKVATRRNRGIDIVLYPVKVQGAGAESEVANAIRNIKDVDVIIVARGGGSAEDLAAFNTELVARAVFESKLPIVSAIGHETDWTLIDFVADLRAPTPSAAAELVVPVVTQAREKLLQIWRHMAYVMTSKLQSKQDYAKNAFVQMKGSMLTKSSSMRSRLELMTGYIENNNPLRVLERGYAKVFAGEKEVKSAKTIKTGDNLRVRMYDGEIKVRVE